MLLSTKEVVSSMHTCQDWALSAFVDSFFKGLAYHPGCYSSSSSSSSSSGSSSSSTCQHTRLVGARVLVLHVS
jgi:hypothetical protein